MASAYRVQSTPHAKNLVGLTFFVSGTEFSDPLPSSFGVTIGVLTYDSTVSIDFGDRALAHLQSVFVAKLRRGESFLFNFAADALPHSVWIHEAIPLHFAFISTDPIAMNRQWLEELTMAASGIRGLSLTPEPQER
jgi:hypothetical protein